MLWERGKDREGEVGHKMVKFWAIGMAGLKPFSKGNGTRARDQISQTVLSYEPQTDGSTAGQIGGFGTQGTRTLPLTFLLILRVKTQSLSLAGSVQEQPGE